MTGDTGIDIDLALTPLLLMEASSVREVFQRVFPAILTLAIVRYLT